MEDVKLLVSNGNGLTIVSTMSGKQGPHMCTTRMYIKVYEPTKTSCIQGG